MSGAVELLSRATARLAQAGVGSPRVDAELLLAHCLGVSRSRVLTVTDVPQEVAVGYDALVARRALREPLQHVVGSAPFRYRELAVGPGVFVPRPETELLVDAVLPALSVISGPLAVDLCAGSGALALALAGEVPGSRVVAVERSEHALAWLLRNAAGRSVEVQQGDVTDPALLSGLRGAVDVVVSNPPYVPDDTAVDAEVRADPAEAVFAGPDGLAVIPAVIERAAQLLRDGGLLALEHDDTHGEVVPALLRRDGRWRDVLDHRDLAGLPRYVTAVRHRSGAAPTPTAG